jgi:porin
LYNNFGDWTDLRNGTTIHENYLVYGSINQGIFRESHYGPGYFKGLDAFIGGDYSPSDVATVPWQITSGLRYTGLIPTRDKDTLAFGVVESHISNAVNTPADLLAVGELDSETAIELNYACQVTGWLLVQPTFQYYFNPGGSQRKENAALLGFRSKVVF